MQRLAREKGAVAVVVALLAIPLIGFAAISIDVAAMHADRQQLQLGADAAALAVAQECAKGNCGSPSTKQPLVETLTDANKNDGSASATVTFPTTSKVTVNTSSNRQHWFAPVIGFDNTDVTASATAEWGVAGGATTLPLIFPTCAIDALINASINTADSGGKAFSFDGTQYVFNGPSELVTLKLAHPSGSTGKTATEVAKELCPPKGVSIDDDGVVQEMPGGFSWIKGISDSVCSASTVVGSPVSSQPGNTGPSACDETYLASLLGKPIPIAVFKETAGSGSGGTYQVYGYVGFTIEALLFNVKSGSAIHLPYKNAPILDGCSTGNGYCLKGRFTYVADLTGPVTPGGAPLGASAVRLTD